MLQVALREFVGVEVQVVGHGLDIENSQVHSARGAAAAMAALQLLMLLSVSRRR